jgi:cell division protein FtsB
MIKEKFREIEVLTEKLKKQLGYVQDTVIELEKEVYGLCGEEEYLAKKSTDNNQENEPI